MRKRTAAWFSDLIGVIDNPSGKLLVGQFVTATVKVAVEKTLLELPTSAINEEKDRSVVFRSDRRHRQPQRKASCRPIRNRHRQGRRRKDAAGAADQRHQ